MAILCSYAHEIVHYFQWYQGKPYSEKEAKTRAVEMVKTFSEYKDGLIALSRNIISLIKKADKLFELGCFQEATKDNLKILDVFSQDEDHNVRSKVAEILVFSNTVESR